MVNSDHDPDKYETISIESKIREGVFHKVVKDLEPEKLFLVLVNVGVKEKSNVLP